MAHPKERWTRRSRLLQSARCMRRAGILLAVGGFTLAYGYGVASHAYRLFPVDQLGYFKRWVIPDTGRPSDVKVFADASGRQEVSCWSIDPDAAVLLAMGQSNAANYGETRYHPVRLVFNYNWVDGKCYR